MNMKKIFKRTSLLLATALIGGTATVQAQKSPQDMDRFIDALMRRMTVEEKIGQLNLPVTGEIRQRAATWPRRLSRGSWEGFSI